MRTISLKLPDDLLAQFDREANARRVTNSQFVRESLVKVLSGNSAGGESRIHEESWQ
jgi:metal-responsive CopG/Arc/MetJ family transcriptional regulator